MFIGVVVYFWQFPPTGWTISAVHALCSWDLMQLGLAFPENADMRQFCSLIGMANYGTYGAGLGGIILVIIGAVKPGKKKDDNSTEYETAYWEPPE